MRTLTSSSALVAAAALSLLAAPSALATPPGDNGTVKIHDAKTGEELRKNEPHVCSFYLDAFGFDARQQVDWRIEAWAPTADVKGETVQSGSLTLDGDGHGRTTDLGLPDGHYKLFWNFDGEHGRAKHKVFWTDCGSEDSKPDDKPSATVSDKPGEQPSEQPSTPAATAPTAPTAAGDSKPSAAPSADGTSGDLAETGNGAPIGLLATLSVALVAGGGYLLARRRTAQRH
ncbi:LPXTG cell wall anchor domain-containing protein [Streptomyces sp. NPDC060064]|uniref:LPXTG cell wall anchor domain-containing protein n=1 Tax=Streptomyces sp. NPDC060064 TaxID=3347049 RepID=UPI00368BF525